MLILGQTLWLRPGLREQVGSAARPIEKGVVCWLHLNRGLLLAKPIRMFGLVVAVDVEVMLCRW